MTSDTRRIKGQKAWKKGFFAEKLACLFLCVKGYRILEWRYKTPVGEIDIIVRKGKTTVFVEVKSSTTPVKATLALRGAQRRRIERAASFYIGKKTHHSDGLGQVYRYDVIGLGRFSKPQHLKNAWMEGE